MSNPTFTLQQVLQAIAAPPSITEYNGLFNLSADVWLYDEKGECYMGHAMYSWIGDDDEQQVASWETFNGWWIQEDTEDGEISDTIIFWQPKE